MRSIILTLFILMLCIPTLSSARDITLSWDQSQDPGITGYKIYYKAGDQGLPLNGNNLPQGASPIVVADPNQTSLLLTLPDDGQVYFFAATAYNDSSSESSFSQIVASAWVPLLISPSDAGAVASSVTLVWSQAPTTYNATYTLYYGTDPDLASAAAPVTSWTGGSGTPVVPLTMALLLLLTLPLLALARDMRPSVPVRFGLGLTLCMMVFGCGGGGGSDIGVTGNSENGTSPSPLFTEVVPDLTDTQLLLYDLEPGQDYYWKVVAVDDQGNTHPSSTQTFRSQ